MPSLCDNCQLNNWQFVNEVIKPALKAAGMEFKSIWCDATDRPENEKWDHCPHQQPII